MRTWSGKFPSPSLQSWSGTLRLPFLWFCEESYAKPKLRDERGCPDSCTSMSSGSWHEVLPQGNIQTSRTVRKMCTEKRGLCRKISNVYGLRLWPRFLRNNKFEFIKKFLLITFGMTYVEYMITFICKSALKPCASI